VDRQGLAESGAVWYILGNAVHEMEIELERTFIMLKPDAVRRKLIGEVIGRIEKRGLGIAAMKMLVPSRELAEAHYAVRGKHLHVVKKTLRKTVTEKIPLRDVLHHKVDKVFLGGYVVTKKGRKHSLFFNTRKEAEGFERMVKQGRRA